MTFACVLHFTRKWVHESDHFSTRTRNNNSNNRKEISTKLEQFYEYTFANGMKNNRRRL